TPSSRPRMSDSRKVSPLFVHAEGAPRRTPLVSALRLWCEKRLTLLAWPALDVLEGHLARVEEVVAGMLVAVLQCSIEAPLRVPVGGVRVVLQDASELDDALHAA